MNSEEDIEYAQKLVKLFNVDRADNYQTWMEVGWALFNIDDLLLDNFIFCDYIDRIIFQKQIWQLTEINYIIKIFYNNYILKKFNLYKKLNFNDIIFTKILTKYSSEYNNFVFLYNILQHFLIDKNDIYVYFENIFNIQDTNTVFDNLINYNITNLEIIRLSKIINNIKNNNTYDIKENNLNLDNIEDNDFMNYIDY